MKIKLKIEKEYDVHFLKVRAGVRYWEDSTVNGVEDNEGSLIPCRNDDDWCPLIDIETGYILNWKQGVTADIHYKVCDAGIYILLDAMRNEITRKEGYVIDMMCPNGGGYGDYIIMKVDENGIIKDFAADFDDFQDDD